MSSALATRISEVMPSQGKEASPPEMVRVPGASWSSFGNLWLQISFWNLWAADLTDEGCFEFCLRGVFASQKITANSSPPMRATISCLRTTDCISLTV